MDYPQPGGLTWIQLTDITSAALAADGCAGWSVCIYNPDLDPGREGADNIVSYLTQAITAADRRLPAARQVRWALAVPGGNSMVMTDFGGARPDVPLT